MIKRAKPIALAAALLAFLPTMSRAAGPAKAEPAKAGPAKAEPAKAGPAKAEPAKAGPAKAEPAKAEPQADQLSSPSRASSTQESSGELDKGGEIGELAIAKNPSVDAMERRISALREKIDRAGAWMDPVVSVEYSNMPVNAPYPGQHPMSGIQLMLKQTFYWPGKVKARKDEAQSQVQQAQLSLEEHKVQLRAAVKQAYYRLAATRQLRKVTQAHVTLVTEFAELVSVKNAAGLGAQHELLRLQVLLEQLRDDLKNFDQDETALSGTINATLHRALDFDIPTPEQTMTAEPTTHAQSLIQMAESERPLLKRFDADAGAYQASARRAAREGYPDITVWAGYRVRTNAQADPGTDFVSLGLSVPLPLSYDSRSGSEQRQNEKLADAAMQEKSAALDDIRGQIARSLAGWQRGAQQARSYRKQLTPQARLALEATFSAYQVDRADFSSLFQSEVQLLNFERTTLMADMNAAEAQVEAEALVGKEVK